MNVRRLYRAGSLKAAAREWARYKFDLLDVQEVRWEQGGTERAGDYNSFCSRGNDNDQLGIGVLVGPSLTNRAPRHKEQEQLR